MAIEDSSGDILEQMVHYEWVSFFCIQCQTAGHDCAKKKGTTNVKAGVPRVIQK